MNRFLNVNRPTLDHRPIGFHTQKVTSNYSILTTWELNNITFSVYNTKFYNIVVNTRRCNSLGGRTRTFTATEDVAS